MFRNNYNARVQHSWSQDDYTQYNFKAWNEFHALIKVAKKFKKADWVLLQIEEVKNEN